jgi:hypothetical protein
MTILTRLLWALSFALTIAVTISPAWAACGQGKAPTYGDIDAIRYEGTNCFGKCPSYEVLFTKKRACYYVGIRYVSKIGTYQGTCSSATFAQAIAVLVNKRVSPRTLADKSGIKRRSIPGPERSPLLATPRSRGRTRRVHGARQPLKRAGARPLRARCAATRSSSVGAGIARRACRKLGGSMASAQSKPPARPSQHKR